MVKISGKGKFFIVNTYMNFCMMTMIKIYCVSFPAVIQLCFIYSIYLLYYHAYCQSDNLKEDNLCLSTICISEDIKKR